MSSETKTAWYWTLLPINASFGAVATLIPLFILSLNGTVIDVGLAASAFNLALIPGALIWGRLIDLVQRRRAFILYPSLAEGLILLAFYFANGLAETTGLYFLFGFVFVALAPAVNMLLMETAPKQFWHTAFAKSSTIMTVGLMLGIIPGAVWTQFFPLRTYFLLAAAFAIPSAILALLLVKEPPITLERETMLRTRASFVHRLTHSPPFFFLKVPRPEDVKSFYSVLRTGLTEELPLISIATFLFFLSTSLFFTSYTPFLKEGGVSNRSIFLVNFLIFFTNAVTFPVAARMNTSYGEVRTAWFAYTIRILGMLLAVVGALALSDTALLLETALVFGLASASFTLWNTALNSIVFKIIGAARRGELLGVYSAFVGFGLFTGSFFSGFISYSLGYAATFAVALITGVLSMGVFGYFRKAPSGVDSSERVP